MLRVVAAVGALGLGLGIGLCSVLLHDYPWGLLLGVVTTVATLVALPGGWARLPFAIGWVVVLWQGVTQRAEGDYLVSADVSGYALMLIGIAVLGAGFVGVARRARPGDGAAEDSGRVETAP